MINPVHTVSYEVRASWVRLGAAGWSYTNVALDEYQQYLREEASPVAEPADDEPWESHYLQQRRLFASAVKTVVFCGMALEAAIFDFAAIQLGDKYAVNVLDKLDLLQKWLVVPRLVCGKALEEDSRGINALRSVVRARNSLVHAKSFPGPGDLSSLRRLEEQSAQLANDVHESFRCVVLLSLELNTLLGTIAGVLPPFERHYLPWSPPQLSELLLRRIERAREIHARSRD